MSIQRLYSLHDSKAVVYNMPFCAANDALAKRLVEDLVTDRNTTVGRHPSDFRLYCIGEFDDESGAIRSYAAVEHIVDAVALLAAPAPSMFDMPLPGLVRETKPPKNGKAR